MSEEMVIDRTIHLRVQIRRLASETRSICGRSNRGPTCRKFVTHAAVAGDCTAEACNDPLHQKMAAQEAAGKYIREFIKRHPDTPFT